MTPDRIRAIRKRLGLTQEEAGRLLGGGARAFTKYESGAMRPRAAAISLLRVLEAHPEAVRVLRGDEAPPARSRDPSPFEVQGKDLTGLRPDEVHELLRRLLSVEAQTNDIPRQGVHVSSNITAPDGGEDGRISWDGKPERTDFLPSRLCQFQLKAGKIVPARAGREVVARGKVKPMVRAVLEGGGHYILLCTRPYNEQQIERRKDRIHAALAEAGLSVAPERTHFRDADQVAAWVNAHPSVALWVQEKIGLGHSGLFAPWDQWRLRSEHSVPWVEDVRLSGLRNAIRDRLTRPRAHLRVVGLSGVGKSRLCLEALGGTGGDPETGRALRDLVMYAVLSEVPDRTLLSIMDRLAASGRRAVVVVDDCDPETDDSLVRLVRRAGSAISLLTIDHEIPSESAAGTHAINVGEASRSVVEGVVEHVAGTLSSFDRQRLARMAAGFPEIALRIGEEAGATQLFDPHPTQLVDRFIVGRSVEDRDLLLRCAKLLAAFRVVRMAAATSGRLTPDQTPTTEDCLAPIAALGRRLTWQDLHTGAQQLASRGVFRRRGGIGSIRPRPIAMRLAERQWREWDPKTWDRVLSGELGAEPAARLAQLGGTGIATTVARHVCRPGGPFDDGRIAGTRADILAHLAEADAESVAYCIERILDGHPDPSQLGTNARHGLLRALTRIAFPAETFEIGARLMMRLLDQEEGRVNEYAIGPFTALFPTNVGATEADGKARLRLLDDILATADTVRTRILAHALPASYDSAGRLAAIGPEVHGARPTLNRWRPATRTELVDYVGGCICRLARLASRDDPLGAECREKLGSAVASLIRRGFVDSVEDAIHRVSSAGHRWTRAFRQLHFAIERPARRALDEATAARVRALIDRLAPTDLYDRVRTLVTEPPMHHDWGVESEAEHRAAFRAEIDAVADELLRTPGALHELLPTLSRGKHASADLLGESIATRSLSPLDWLDPIAEAVEAVPAAERNHDLFVGFAAGVADRYGDQADALKRRAVESPALAPAFPEICRRTSLTPEDVAQGIEGLARGMIPSAAMMSWMRPETLDPLPHPVVAQLLDALFDHDATSFAIGVTTLSMLVGRKESNATETRGPRLRFGDFAAQVRTMARNRGRWRERDSQVQTPTGDWCFSQVVVRTLQRGRGDEHARETALALSKGLVDGGECGWLDMLGSAVRDILRELLAGFPGIAWQIIGAEIVSNERFAYIMWISLGERGEPMCDHPPILALSEEALLAWCHVNPDRAPAFAVRCVPILAGSDGSGQRPLHPVMARLMGEFGERGDVQEAFKSSLQPRGVVSSIAEHYAEHEGAVGALRGHRRPEVRRWARRLSQILERDIAHNRRREEEGSFQRVQRPTAKQPLNPRR